MFEIQTFSVKYGRTYSGTVSVEAPSSIAGFQPWLAKVVARAAAQSRAEPLDENRVRQISAACEMIVAAPRLPSIWATAPEDLTRDGVRDIFDALENRLAESGRTGKRRTIISEYFRNFCFKHLRAVGGPPRITKTAVQFRTRFTERASPRKLISDFADDDLSPLGATRHENVRELRAKVLQRAEMDLERIQEAAVRELEAAGRVRELFEEVGREVDDVAFIQEVNEATTSRYSVEWYREGHYFISEPRRYLGALVLAYDANGWRDKDTVKWGVLFGRTVDDYIRAVAQWNAPVQRLLNLRAHASAQELFAACLILQVVTGWNISSVLALRLEGIRIVDTEVFIQSYKSKTDDDTPPVEIGKIDPDQDNSEREFVEAASTNAAAIRAVELLLWNHRQMIVTGHKEQTDTRLFSTVLSRTSRDSLTIAYLLRNFIARYELPRFSCEQLRTQVLFTESLGDLESARRRAGHKEIRTTGSYVHQEISKRLSSSMNLEMQRRLHDEVVQMLQAPVKMNTLKLLRPIGDGASCVDPTRPPWDDAAENFICPAERCHSAGGCANRRLQIDEKSISDALRMHRVYSEHWRELLAENQHKFLEVHVPKIVFNIAYLRVVEEGRYAHVAARVRKELEQ